MHKITKNRFALIISMLFVIAITSCEKEEAAVEQDDLSAEADQELSGRLINVTGETSGGGTTKTTLVEMETWWKGVDDHSANPDKVGIFSPQARTLSEGGDPISNTQFTAQTSAKSSAFEGVMYWGEAEPHDFYAYYPWEYVEGEHCVGEVFISLASEQIQSGGNNSDHIGTLDFMVATPVIGVSPGEEGEGTSGVNFRYNHVFTLLEFKITGSGELSKVKLSGPGTLAFGQGIIDISQDTPDKGVAYEISSMDYRLNSDLVTVSIYEPVELSGEDSVSVYMMINPGDHSGDMAIGLEIDGDYTYMAKSPPAGGFERGKKYVVELDAVDFANEVTFTYRGQEVTYGIVLGAKGRLWMDRNLGASQVATSTNDSDAYGDLFQWGRLDDGHQDRESETTDVLSEDDDPGHNDFILTPDSPHDWRDGQNDNLWQEFEGTILNNVCPVGWRVPTETEFAEERESWSSRGPAGAFGSPLKLPTAGVRNHENDYDSGTNGYYWSSTVSTSYSSYLTFGLGISGSGYDMMNLSIRANGFSVRCIKDD